MLQCWFHGVRQIGNRNRCSAEALQRELMFEGERSGSRCSRVPVGYLTARLMLGETRSAMTRIREPNGVEPEKSEDDIQREQLGPRGVPGAPDPARMTPQREKKTPKHIDPGHTA